MNNIDADDITGIINDVEIYQFDLSPLNYKFCFGECIFHIIAYRTDFKS